MIGFSIENYISYSLSALIYGGVFSFFVCSAPVLYEVVLSFFFYFYKSVFYSGSPRALPVPKRLHPSEKNRAGILGEIFSAITVIVFFCGFTIVSYYEMDGSGRLFAAVLSIVSLLLFKSFVFPHVLGKLQSIILSVFRFLALLIRYLTYPIHATILHFFAKIVKKYKLNEYFSHIYRAIAIDNSDNKC